MQKPRVLIDFNISEAVDGPKRTVSVDVERIDAVLEMPNLRSIVIVNGYELGVDHSHTEVLDLMFRARRLIDERERGRHETAENKVTPVHGGVL